MIGTWPPQAKETLDGVEYYSMHQNGCVDCAFRSGCGNCHVAPIRCRGSTSNSDQNNNVAWLTADQFALRRLLK